MIMDAGNGFSSNLIFLSDPPDTMYLPFLEIETDFTSSLV